MFEQALKLASPNGLEDLGSIPNISRRTLDELETFLFRAPVPCLEYVSLLIENALLLRTNRTGRIYAGFAKLSRMEPVIDRYLRIADVSEQVFVFGEADWKPPRHPNMKLITFPGTFRLAREWFLVADSHTLRAALVATDEDETEAHVALEARIFRAFKSSDPKIVAGLAASAEGLIDSSLAA
ncbi:MAG TPA: DICT sensory domain-containing protein [Pyrinomonadaceae bacterium]|jgi:DICT domain-containing protein